MPIPSLARNDADGDRLYTFGRPPEGFYSVTTIIAGGVPKFLVPWASKAVADLVYRDLRDARPQSRVRAALRRWEAAGRADLAARQEAGELTSLKPAKITGPEFTTRYLKGEPDRIRDAAGSKGIDFHDEAERHILHLANQTAIATMPDARIRGENAGMPDWPEHLHGHRDSFLRFLTDWQPRYQAAEMTVFNRREAFAGTLDAIIDLPARIIVAALAAARAPVPRWLADMVRADPDAWVTICLDYKSGNDVYAEVGLQLSAYSRGEFVGAPDGVTELPMPVIHAGAVLHVTPKGYRFRLVRIDDRVYRSFLHAREVFRFRKEIAPRVFIADLTPRHEEAA